MIHVFRVECFWDWNDFNLEKVQFLVSRSDFSVIERQVLCFKLG